MNVMSKKSKMSKLKYVLIILVVLSVWQSYEFLRRQGGLMGLDIWGYLCVIISDALLRVITLILMAVLGMQTIVLCLITKANRNPSETQSSSSEHFSEQSNEPRGRGRPRKPCALATTGLFECPLAPDAFEPPAKLVQRVAEQLRETETPEQLAKRLEERIREPRHEEEKPKKEPGKEKPKQNKKDHKKQERSGIIDFLRTAIKEKDGK